MKHIFSYRLFEGNYSDAPTGVWSDHWEHMKTIKDVLQDVIDEYGAENLRPLGEDGLYDHENYIEDTSNGYFYTIDMSPTINKAKRGQTEIIVQFIFVNRNYSKIKYDIERSGKIGISWI